MERMDLEAAGKLYGITQSAMRARAKKQPALYGLERDNAGKLWVNIDPSKAEPSKLAMKAATPPEEPAMNPALEAALNGRIEDLKALVAAESKRADSAEARVADIEADRDAWKAQAQRGFFSRLFG